LNGFRAEIVGWFERSETRLVAIRPDLPGFAVLNPAFYEPCCVKAIVGSVT